MFCALHQTGRATFRIEPDLPLYRRKALVLVEDVDLRMRGLPFRSPEDVLLVHLTHQGDPTIIDRHGREMTFRHRPRVQYADFKNEEKRTISLGGFAGKYAYLSPFATWTVEVVSGPDGPRDLSGINEIGMWLRGVAYASYRE